MTHCYTMWSVEFTASQRGEEKAAGKRLTAQQQLQTLQSSIFYRLKGKLHLVIKKPTKTAKDRDKIKIDLQIKNTTQQVEQAITVIHLFLFIYILIIVLSILYLYLFSFIVHILSWSDYFCEP